MPLPQSARKLRRLLETAEEPVRGQALADRLRVSQRHLRRLVDTLQGAGVSVEKDRDGRERTYSIPPDARRKRVPVHLSPRALRRLYELAKDDDPADPESAKASTEAAAALRRALRAEPRTSFSG